MFFDCTLNEAAVPGSDFCIAKNRLRDLLVVRLRRVGRDVLVGDVSILNLRRMPEVHELGLGTRLKLLVGLLAPLEALMIASVAMWDAWPYVLPYRFSACAGTKPVYPARVSRAAVSVGEVGISPERAAGPRMG